MANRIGKWWKCGVAALVLLSPACSSDKAAPQPVPSQLQQSCEKTADCVSGLACVNQVCTSINRKLVPNNKECAIVECSVATAATDCCANFLPLLSAATCANYQSYCASDPTVYASYCTAYQTDCVCNPAGYVCEDGACNLHTACTVDTNCGIGRCVAGSCVECSLDTDCGTTEKCSANKCVPKCAAADECKAFEDCQGEVCVHVGCKFDRECLVSPTGAHPGLGFCDTSLPTPECALHCGTDVDCPGLDPITHTAEICAGGRCVSAGCETPDECKVLLSYNPGPNDGTHVECRPRAQ